MNRSCFALSILLATLALSLLALGSARSVANEFECGFYPDWHDVAALADRRDASAADDLCTGYDPDYDSAVCGVKAAPAGAVVQSVAAQSEAAQSPNCRESWMDYTCGHDWISEEYQPYDYVEDHVTAEPSSGLSDVDFSQVIQLAQTVVDSTKRVEISPGAWISYASHKAANAVSGSRLIQSIGSSPATSSVEQLVATPDEESQRCDEWDYWYDERCDLHGPVETVEPAAIGVKSLRFGKNLVLVVARAMHKTGESLRNVSEYMVEVAGIEVAELTYSPNEGVRQR